MLQYASYIWVEMKGLVSNLRPRFISALHHRQKLSHLTIPYLSVHAGSRNDTVPIFSNNLHKLSNNYVRVILMQQPN